MKLQDLINAVKEKNLTKTQLESYRDDLAGLFAQMQLELADLEKAEALFFMLQKDNKAELSDVAIKRMWKASAAGQREIELRHYCIASKELINSLRSRLYSIY